MSTNKKIERALYGPSWTEVFIGALLSFAIGMILAVVFLVLKPVEKVKEIKDPVRGVVYYIEGSKDATKGRSGPAKQKDFIAGRSVALNEDELNSLFATAAPAPAAAPGAKAPPAKAAAPAAPAAPAAAGMFAPTSPNFHFVGEQLQIAVPTTLNAFGISAPVTLLATGSFVKSGESFVFSPDTFYVGSMLASRVPFFKKAVMSKIMAAQPVASELAGAWGKLTDVSIADKTLKLTMP